MTLPAHQPAASRPGKVRIPLLLAASFLLGLGSGAILSRRAAAPAPPAPPSPEIPAGQLSAGTRSVLQRLNEPVNIRFYALLDSATTPASLAAYARRTSQLLAAVEQESRGKIKVTSYLTLTDDAATAAAADGISPFNQHLGNACFLGMALRQQSRREALAQLAPEWEAGLEADLGRAIARVSTPAPSPAPAFVAPIDQAAIDEVKRALPNFAVLSAAEGIRILREQALADLGLVARDMAAKINLAEQRFTQAQSEKSETAMQSARAELQQLQAERTEKLGDIALRLQARITALEQLKKP